MKKLISTIESINAINTRIMAGLAELYNTKGTCYSEIQTEENGNYFILIDLTDTRNIAQFLTEEQLAALVDYTPIEQSEIV